jgi:cysteine desulfurase
MVVRGLIYQERQQMKPIYLDYNATTPIANEVADAMLPYLFEFFGNPSSSHFFGVQTKMAVEFARKQIADLISARPSEIIFTSGGTEANNYAINGYCLKHQKRGKHIITSSIEHPAVIEVCNNLLSEGFELTVLPVDHTGMVNVNELKSAIRDDTILISIMHANNEVGTIQPIKEIAKIANEHQIVFHSDAAQSTGKIPVNVNELGVDLLSIAGHKLYAPKGVGVLFVREGIEISNLMHGAGHERGKRPGTENVLEIVGLGKACEIANRDLALHQVRLQTLRDFLHSELISAFGAENLRLNGHPDQRLPNTLNISIKGVEAYWLLTHVNDFVAISAGSACHADQVSISRVLMAMEVPGEWARGALRISVGRETTEEEIRKAVSIIKDVVRSE